MSTSNSIANGARLDDCHSSVFSLADLSGIKWCRFASMAGSLGLADDPVLVGFTKCLANDILAVWRRSPKKSSTMPLNSSNPQDTYDKELWIFWWGDEPNVDEISQHKGLRDEERGSWGEGLSYECRTLLFKAIHNLVERCLLNENFVRLGKWFVKPFNKELDEDICDRFSFSFSFFLHGENTVCTTVEVAKHQTLERLTYQHLQGVRSGMTQNAVILAPFGLEAKLTGDSVRSPHDPTVKKLLEEWRPFYPLGCCEDYVMDENDEDLEDQIPVPAVVEISIGGAHMNYPSHFVLTPLGVNNEGKCNIPQIPPSPIKQNPTTPSHQERGKPTVLGRYSSSDVRTPKSNSIADGPLSVASQTGPLSVCSTLNNSPVRAPILSLSTSATSNSAVVPPTNTQRTRVLPTTCLSSCLVDRVRIESQLTSLKEASGLSSHVDVKVEQPDQLNTARNQKFTDSFKGVRNDCVTSNSQDNNHSIKLEGGIYPIKLEKQQKSNNNLAPTAFHRRITENTTDHHPDPALPNYNQSMPQIRTPVFSSEVSENVDFAMQSDSNFMNLKLGGALMQNGVSDKFKVPRLSNILQDDINESKPFVSLGNNHNNIQQWQDIHLMHTNNNFAQHAENNQKIDLEITRTVGEWKTYKLPRKVENFPVSMVNRPSLKRDSLDPKCYKPTRSTIDSLLTNQSFTSKRLKVEKIENSSTNVKLEQNLQFNQQENNNLNSQVIFGPSKGHLAGMMVATDPYDFDDDIDDSITQNNYNNPSEISLKPCSQNNQSAWPAVLINNNNDNNFNSSVKSEIGRNCLEALLKSPVTGPTPISPFPGNMNISSKSIKKSSDLDFSMDDLTEELFADEDNTGGAPTPPDDVGDRNHLPPVTNTAVTSDLQCILPTPPSNESFSPEGKPVHPNLSHLTHHIDPDLMQMHNIESAYKSTLGGDRVDSSMIKQLEFSIQRGTPVESTSQHHATNLSIFPIPPIYQPLNMKYMYSADNSSNELPHNTITYTPSWLLPSAMPPAEPYIIQDESAHFLNFQPVTPATPGVSISVNPGTPNRSSSIRTPASTQPLFSPATFSVPTPRTPRTPGRGGIRSVDPLESPASSLQTPNSHFGNRSVCVDHHGNAGISMTLLLSDSVFNLFRDHSFDQCALCVCNMNINGADVEMGYLPNVTAEPQYRCSCGFSAVRNRMASVGTGLFLEDELEIVGPKFEETVMKALQPNYKKEAQKNKLQLAIKGNLENTTEGLQDLLKQAMSYCATPFQFNVYDRRELRSKMNESHTGCDNIIVRRDQCEAFAQALSTSLSSLENSSQIDPDSLLNPIHRWKESQLDVLSCASSFDVYRLLVSLKPVLQDAIQRKKTSRSYGTTQHVRGPLTWREFCKESGKNAEPQPIPSLLVGYDQDRMSVSPHALKHWEKLMLLPYSQHRDVGYVVVCPDGDNIIAATKLFFKELSSLYESCRLGKLKPINRVLKENGILKISKTSSQNLSNLPLDPLFEQYLNSANLNKSYGKNGEVENLILYAQNCLHNLGPLLKAEESLELSSLHVRENRSRAQQGITSTAQSGRGTPFSQIGSRPQSTGPGGQIGQNFQSNSNNNNKENGRNLYPVPYNAQTASTIVVFIIDPFKGNLSHGLWQSFLLLQNSLPKPIRDHIVLQIIPLENVVQATSTNNQESFVQFVRGLSFSTYAQCRRNLPYEVNIRSMTCFGPSACDRTMIKGTDRNKEVSSLYSPPYILSAPRNQTLDTFKNQNEAVNCNVLFVTYCLSHNQKFLLASATDQCGEMLETCCINIEVPIRRLSVKRKHRVSVRSTAIGKLWRFCINAATKVSTESWRIVLGRLGRLSHGEIRDWAKYLNRNSLLVSGKKLQCSQCRLQQNNENSTLIISACLTSLEPDAAIMLMPDIVQTNNFGRSSATVNQSSQLKTPGDVSVTHIYVFPTSAIAQLPAPNYPAGGEEELNLGTTDTDDLLPADILEDELLMEITGFGGLMNPSSPVNNPHPFNNIDDDIIKPSTTDHSLSTEGGEDASLSQQPLALGYLVSTAPPGPLPAWFWANCPQAKSRCPVFLRSALHIQTSITDSGNRHGKNDGHPLDSTKTAVVLRFVLENYNALSWLTRDPVSTDRRSCLPVHCLSLMQLYKTIQNIL